MNRSWLGAPQAVAAPLAPPLLVAFARRGQFDAERRTTIAVMVAPPVRIAQAIYERARRVVKAAVAKVIRIVVRPAHLLAVAAGTIGLPPPGDA